MSKRISKKNPPTKSSTAERDIVRGGDVVYRSATVEHINVEERRVVLAFSSEYEVERWFGIEVLDHSPGAIDGARMGSAPLLDSHDARSQVGKVERWWVGEDRKGRSEVRFGKSARAEELFRDVVDEIVQNVSVGYRVKGARLIETRNDDVDVWLVTRWEPLEISLVGVPADPTVGIGRSFKEKNMSAQAKSSKNKDASRRPTALPARSGFEEDTEESDEADDDELPEPPFQRVDVKSDDRARRLLDIGSSYGELELAAEFVREGKSAMDLQKAILDKMNARTQKPIAEQVAEGEIGMSRRELERFSFQKLLRGLSATDPSMRKKSLNAAAFELETCAAARKKMGGHEDRTLIPIDVMTRAPMTAAAANVGGKLIEPDYRLGSMIDMLEKRSTFLRLGAIMAGLKGPVRIPKILTGTGVTWVGEDEAGAETGMTFGEIELLQKTATARVYMTRTLLQQESYGVESLIRKDLARAMAAGFDLAGYYGTGSANKQPKGMATYTDINRLDLAGTQATYNELVEMESKITDDDADVDSMVYVAHSRFRSHGKTTLRTPGIPGYIWESGNTVNGYRIEISNRINVGDFFFGNFADAIVGMWGSLELQVDPYTAADKGAIKIIAFHDFDWIPRRLESFCFANAAVTP